MTNTDIFLDETQLIRFTGRKAKSRQIQWLRSEGVTFRVNATGHPVVTRTAAKVRLPALTPATIGSCMNTRFSWIVATLLI